SGGGWRSPSSFPFSREGRREEEKRTGRSPPWSAANRWVSRASCGEAGGGETRRAVSQRGRIARPGAAAFLACRKASRRRLLRLSLLAATASPVGCAHAGFGGGAALVQFCRHP